MITQNRPNVRREKSLELLSAVLPHLEPDPMQFYDISLTLGCLVDEYENFMLVKGNNPQHRKHVWSLLVAIAGNARYAAKVALACSTDYDYQVYVNYAWNFYAAHHMSFTNDYQDKLLPYLCKAIASWDLDCSNPNSKQFLQIKTIAKTLMGLHES